MPRENHVNEASIVWVRGSAADYPYLRETTILASSRYRGIGKLTGHTRNVVAYATLTPHAPNYGFSGRFRRRVWIFRKTDPYPIERDHPNYAHACPCEGVKPSSIRAGFPSESGRE